MARSPIADFAANAVCLRTVGQQIRSQESLRNVCLVSRLFNAEFSPSLYRHMVVTNPPMGLEAVWKSRYLRFARHLSVSSKVDYYTVANELVRGLLPHMPGLEVFAWKGCLQQDTIDALHKHCARITSLDIKYPVRFEQYILLIPQMPEEERYYERSEEWLRDVGPQLLFQNFGASANLTEITLMNLHNDIDAWHDRIAQLLVRSPNLKKLALSLSRETIIRMSYSQSLQHDFTSFFYGLCNQYPSLGGEPLKLSSLHCGTSVLPFDIECLQRLIDLDYLERLYIDNGGVTDIRAIISLYPDQMDSGIPFDVFLSNCPRLRSFSATEMREDVLDALSASPVVSQLAVSFRKPHSVCDLPLRMLDVVLPSLEDEDGFELDDIDIEAELDRLVASHGRTLEGLAVRLNTDALESSDVPEDQIEALLRVLPGLEKLTQLEIGTTPDWEYTSEYRSREMGLVMAERLANAISGLRFVGVDGCYWRVWRAEEDDTGSKIKLEDLREEREFLAVELFDLCRFSDR